MAMGCPRLRLIPFLRIAKGYFSSSRNAAEDDVFQFEKRVPVVIDTPEIVVEVEYKIILDVYLLEKVYQEAFNPNSKVHIKLKLIL